MNKKFLSAILFGSLMATSTGTFVSCKDYDDDISGLQGDINSTKAGLEENVKAIDASVAALATAKTELEEAIVIAKADAEKAASAAEEAAIAAADAKLAALAAQEVAIATASAELAATKTEIMALVSANEQDIELLNEKVATIEADLAETSGRIAALETFQGTTETALKALQEADAALDASLTTISAAVAANFEQIGKNKAAIEAQIIALELYKTSNDATTGGHTSTISDLQDKLNEHAGQLEALNGFDIEALTAFMNETKPKLEKISTDITDINTNLDVISATLRNMVTGVSLDVTEWGSNFDYIGNNKISLSSATAVLTTTFGPNDKETISFVKGEKATFPDEMVIRVSPANAVLNPGMISFVNSKGQNLSDFINVTAIAPYDELITTRGISATGLWTISMELKTDCDLDALKSAIQVEETEKEVYFAVAVTEKTEDEKDVDRIVTSEYKVIVDADKKKIERELSFKVNGTPVGELRNRYATEDVPGGKLLLDASWDKTAFDKDEREYKVNQEDRNDIRQNNLFLPVKIGEKFTVSFENENSKFADIKGFYVELDVKRTTASDASEIAAWTDSYTYEGLNTLSKIGELDITITSEAALNDEIGFRVFAVNIDGTLVDPDGKAFYVSTYAQDGNLVLESILNASDDVEKIAGTASSVDFKAISHTIKSAFFTADNLDVASGTVIADSKIELEVSEDKGKTFNAYDRYMNWTNVTHIRPRLASDKMITDYLDGATYSGKLELKNDKGFVLKTVTVNMTKVMPIAFPKDFSPKTNQMGENRLFTSYMVHAEGVGTKDFYNVFNGLDEDYLFTFKGEKDLVLASPYVHAVADELIDGTTKHSVEVAYNYGAISAIIDENGNAVIREYSSPETYDFTMIYACHFDVETWAWGTKPDLKYGEENQNIAISTIKGANLVNGDYTDTLDKLLNPNMIISIDEAVQVNSKGSTYDNEYFVGKYVDGSIAFTPSMLSNPKEDVDSELVVTYTDMFGHKQDIVLSILVKKK